MHLTAGQYKGRKIAVPNGVKPTLSKVRESVFNMLLSFEFSDKTFLDMCAGSAIMGLEAVSRGYNVVELEINKKNASIIKQNYANISLKANLIITDCLKYKTDRKFDVIYLDPPWANNYSDFILKAYQLINENGVLILEYDEQYPQNIEEIISLNKLNFKIVKSKKYGRCLIDFLQKF